MPLNTVLLVDDDKNIVASFAANLCREFVITTANSAEEGLRLFITSGPFAVVVSDLKMPGKDGVYLLSEVKKIKDDTVCIMLTGYADVETAIDLLNKGILFRLLTKPVSMDALKSSLRSALAQHNLLFEKRMAEEQLALANKMLEQRVIERTQELRRTNEQLTLEIAERTRTEALLLQAKELAEAGNRAKTEFLANMSHETRTPLNGVLGMLQLLQHSGLTAAQNDKVNVAISSAQHLSRLLSDILDLAKLEDNKISLINEEFDLETLKKHILKCFYVAVENKKLSIDFYIDPKIPHSLRGDSKRLSQVLFNLVGNAVKYTMDGSVTITVSLLPRRSQELLHLLFTVQDTGIGISESKLRAIFDTFTQGEEGAARRFEGAGLGLAIVARLVALMRGALAVDTELGQGTTVYFSLPFPVASSNLVETARCCRDAFCDKKILIATSDPILKNELLKAMQGKNYILEFVGNGLDALCSFYEEDYSGVVVDDVLEGISALNLIETIRSPSLGEKSKRPLLFLHSAGSFEQKENYDALRIDALEDKQGGVEVIAKFFGAYLT